MQMALKAWEHLLVAYLPQPGPDAAHAAEERTYRDMIQPVLRIIFKMVPGKNDAVKESALKGPHDRHLLLSEVDVFTSTLVIICIYNDSGVSVPLRQLHGFG